APSDNGDSSRKSDLSPFGSDNSLLAVDDSAPEANRPTRRAGGSHPLKSNCDTMSNSTVKSEPKGCSLSVKTTVRCAMRSHCPAIPPNVTTTALPLLFHPTGSSPTASPLKSFAYNTESPGTKSYLL